MAVLIRYTQKLTFLRLFNITTTIQRPKSKSSGWFKLKIQNYWQNAHIKGFWVFEVQPRLRNSSFFKSLSFLNVNSEFAFSIGLRAFFVCLDYHLYSENSKKVDFWVCLNKTAIFQGKNRPKIILDSYMSTYFQSRIPNLQSKWAYKLSK